MHPTLTELPVQSVRDRVLLLRSMAALSSLERDALVLIAEHARERNFAAGEVIIVEGESMETVYLVIRGQVTVTKEGKLIAVVERGYGMGFVSLLARDEQGVHAVANVATRTLALPSDVLLNAFEENFSLVRNSIRLQAATVVQRRGDLPADPKNPPKIEIGTYRERELTLVERMLAIRQTPLFANANIDATAELARANIEVRYEPDTVLWRIGDPSSFSLRIVYGRVQCTNSAGEQIVVGGDYGLGVLDSFSTRPRSYEARTETKVIAFRSNLETFLAIMEANFDLSMELIAILARTQLRVAASHG